MDPNTIAGFVYTYILIAIVTGISLSNSTGLYSDRGALFAAMLLWPLVFAVFLVRGTWKLITGLWKNE